MPKEIFVSYARADKEVVIGFLEKLKKEVGDHFWVDLNGIESGSEFDDKIVKAIDSAQIIMFMHSENSLNSKWAKREMDYADDEGKRVIPVVIEGDKLKGWFKFKFGNKEFVNIKQESQVARLIAELNNEFGTSQESTQAPADDIKSCLFCNAEIHLKSKFCPECGQKQNCPECGNTELPPRVKFCPECGFRFNIQAATPTPQPVKAQKSEDNTPPPSPEIQRGLDKISPYVDKYISTMTYDKDHPEGSLNVVGMYSSQAFKQLAIANYAMENEAPSVFITSYISTFMGDNRFCDYSMSAHDVINEFNNEFSFTTTFSAEELNQIISLVEKCSGKNLSVCKIGSYDFEEIYRDDMQQEILAIEEQITAQAAFYPQLKRCIEAIDKYFNQSNNEALFDKYKEFAKPFVKGPATAESDNHTLTACLTPTTWDRIIEDIPDIRPLLEECEEVSQSIMNIAEEGKKAAINFESKLNEINLDMFTDKDFLLTTVFRTLLENGVTAEQIIQGLKRRTNFWEWIQSLNKLFDEDDSENSDEENQNEFWNLWSTFGESMTIDDPVMADQFWTFASNAFTFGINAELMQFYPDNKAAPSKEKLQQQVLELVQFQKEVLNEPEQKPWLMEFFNQYFDNSSEIYIQPVPSESEEEESPVEIDMQKILCARDELEPELFSTNILFYMENNGSRGTTKLFLTPWYIRIQDNNGDGRYLYESMDNISCRVEKGLFLTEVIIHIDDDDYVFYTSDDTYVAHLCRMLNDLKEQIQ